MKTILFLGSLCSGKVFHYLLSGSNNNSSIATQKYFHVLIHGLSQHSNVEVNVFSSLPISRSTHKKFFFSFPNDTEERISFKYPLVFNIFFIKHFYISLDLILYLLYNKIILKKELVLLINGLNFTTSAVGTIFAKLLKIKTCCYLTDMPGLDVVNKYNAFTDLRVKLLKYFVSKMDGFIFVTKHMASKLDLQHKKHSIMEGMVKFEKHLEPVFCIKQKKIILYAGGLYKEYGIDIYLSAINDVVVKNVEFHFYGAGPMEEMIKGYSKMDSRVQFFGILDNESIQHKFREAYLLINPRKTNHPLTNYSFPSKIFDYMSSGTPVLTTKLAGLTDEYFDHLYFIDEETERGIADTINKILILPDRALYEKGLNAFNFMLNEKNNIKQTKKIIDLLEVL